MQFTSKSTSALRTAASRPNCLHRPEPHILLFRRALGTDPVTGKINAAVAAQAKAAFEAEYSGAAERK